MPFRKRTEDAPDGGPGTEPRAPAPTVPQTLTVELLDWLIAALEAVIKTPQVQELAERRAAASLRDALKFADHLYPHTEEVQRVTRAYALERDRGLALRAVADDEVRSSSSSMQDAGTRDANHYPLEGPTGGGLP